MSLRIKAGVLQREGKYFGAQSVLPSDNFDFARITNIRQGYLTPYSDGGLGSPTYVNGFTETNVSGSGKVSAQFDYENKFNEFTRYVITCNSADLITAQSTSTNVNVLTVLAVATGSGYTLAS